MYLPLSQYKKKNYRLFTILDIFTYTYMKKNKLLFLLNLTVLASLMLFSFSCSDSQKETAIRQAKGNKKYGGNYRINMVRGNPNGLDPVIINSKLADDIAQQIYDRLITFDSNLNTVPELAHRWEISDDGKLYTFFLRNDVYFHDNPCFSNGKGRKLIASDIVYSLTRACDPQSKTVAFWAFKGKVKGADEYYAARLEKSNKVTNISGIQAPNDTTLTIELLRAYHPFLLTLVNGFGCVVPHEAVEYYKDNFFRNPVGSGPFMFTEWKDDQHLTLRRNPQYWQKDTQGNRLPFLDNITVTFIKDDKVQHNEFMKGGLEESFTIPTEFFPTVFNEKKEVIPPYTAYNVQQKPALLTWFINLLCAKPPFNNPDIRRALSYAIDREKIVKYVLRNAPYQPAHHGINPPVMPGYDIKDIEGIAFNPTKAREYLQKAGFTNGADIPSITLSVYQEPRLVQVAEAVQQMIKEHLNISINIQVLQFAELLQRAEHGKLDCWGTRWYGDYPDPENYLNLWDGSLVPAELHQVSYPNETRYVNKEMTEILAQAVGTNDPIQRMALYKKAENIAIKESPSIVLFYEMHYRLLQPYVRDYPLDAMARVVLKNVWLDK